MMISHLHFLFLTFKRGMTLILDEIQVNPTVNLVEAPKPIHDPKKIPSQLLQYNTSYIWTTRNIWRFPSYGGTPSYHPLLDRIFHEIKPSSDLGVPPLTMKTPICFAGPEVLTACQQWTFAPSQPQGTWQGYLVTNHGIPVKPIMVG